MAEVNRLEWDAYIRDSELMASINRIERRVNGMVDNVNKKGNDFEAVFKRMAQAATAFFTINQAQNFVNQLISVRSQFQQLEIAFTTMLGSKEKADQLTKDLIQFAATTPFGMKDAANAAKQLLAYGSTASGVKDELRMLGDVAAGTSQPIGDLVYLYGTLRTQGRAYLMDIRQFAGRGIPIYQELAKVLNVSKGEVNDLVSAGKVGFAEIEQAFKNMTVAGSMFGGLMEAQSKTIQGELERLGDAYDEMLNNIGKNTEGTIGQAIQGLSFLVENYEKVITIVTSLVTVYGAYRAALVVNAAMLQLNAARAVGMTAAEMLHYGAIVAKTAAQKALNAVMLASPVMAYTALISALGAAVYSLTQVTDATTASIETLNKVKEEGAKQSDKEARSIQQLVSVLKDNTATAEQKKAAYDKLIAQTGDILLSYSKEEIATGKATATLDEYIAKIREATSVRKAFSEFNELAEKMDELNRKGIDGISTWTKLGRSLKNTFIPTSQDVGFGDWAKSLFSSEFANNQVLDQEKKVLETQMNDLKKTFGDKWAEVITGVKDDVTGATTEVSKTVSERLQQIDKEIASTKQSLKNAMSSDAVYDKKKLESYNETLKTLQAEKYAILGITNESKKAGKELQKFTDEREAIFKKIAERKYEHNLSEKAQDEQELTRIRKFYDDLRKEIEKFNKTSPIKIKGSTLDVLTNMENADLGFKRQEQLNAKKLKKYEEDYENYVRYEQLKKEAGENYANEQLGKYTKAFEKLKAEYVVMSAMQFSFGLSSVDSAYYKQLGEIVKKENDRVANASRENYVTLLKDYSTYHQKREQLIKKANKDIAVLESKGDKERAEEVKRQLAKSLSEMDLEYFKDQTGFEKLMEFVQDAGIKASREALKQGKAIIQEFLKGTNDASKIKALKDLLKPIDEALHGLNIEDLEIVTSAVNGFDQLVSQASQFDGTMVSALKTISSMVNQVGDLVKGLSNASTSIGKTMSSVGASLGAFGAVLGILGTITQIGEASNQRKQQEYLEKTNYSYDYQLKQMQGITSILEYQLSLIKDIYGTDRITSYARVMENAAKAFKESASVFDGQDFDAFNPKSKTNELTLLRGRMDGKKYQLTGIADYDRIIEGINKGQDVMKMYGNTPKKLDKLLNDYDRMIKEGLLIPIEIGFTEASKMTAEEIQRLNELVKSNKLDEITKQEVQNIIDQYEIWKDAMNQLREELTGISFKSLTDGIVSMFEQGKTSVEDFTDFFEKQMQQAILKGFSRDAIEKQMQPWYELFAQYSEDGLTQNEITKLRDQYLSIMDGANKQWEDLMKVTGVDFGSNNSSPNTLSGAYARASQESIDLLAGQTGAMRTHLSEMAQHQRAMNFTLNQQIQIANDNLLQVIMIERNTRATAQSTTEYLPHLKNIEANTRDSLSTQLRAAGKFGY